MSCVIFDHGQVGIVVIIDQQLYHHWIHSVVSDKYHELQGRHDSLCLDPLHHFLVHYVLNVARVVDG